MCDWTTSDMYKIVGKEKAYINVWSKDEVDNVLKKYNIKLDTSVGYDYVFVANMCRADYLGSSIMDEGHVAMFIKDYVDDPDGYDGLPFTRFYADCIGSGKPIMWEDML